MVKLRKLGSIEDRSIDFTREDSMELVRKRALELMEKQFQRNERKYSLRSRTTNFVEGQEVFRRNFKQSNFEKGYNAKLDRVFVKARVRKKVGTCNYELEDLKGNYVGRFHAKDIKAS